MTRRMRLRARWTGKPPSVGDYLQSPRRPRCAYRVCEVTCHNNIVRWDPCLKTEFSHYAIVADRVELASVPEGARVHAWNWSKRRAAKID